MDKTEKTKHNDKILQRKLAIQTTLKQGVSLCALDEAP